MIDPNIEEIKQIAEFYGWEAQSRQLIEEMSELTKAINKLYRLEKYPWQFVDYSQFNTEDDDHSAVEKIREEIDSYKYPILSDISEEITDVEICLAEIKYLLKKSYDWGSSYEDIKKNKLDREIYRITKCSDSEKETMERAIINSLPAGTEERIKNEIFKKLFREFGERD